MNIDNIKKYFMNMGLIPDKSILINYINNFISEMNKGLNGEESSLKMIPSYLKYKKITNSESIIVIDAGGTNLRIGIVKFLENGQYFLDSYKKTTLPGIDREYTKEEFFDYIYKFIKDEVRDYKKIGFCFSYPMEKFPNKDGKLIKWTKEVKAPEVVGEFIGKNILYVFDKYEKTKRDIVLLNDTVASLFGGIANSNIRDYENFIGLIVGTGCNSAYLEKLRNIKKLNKEEYRQDEEMVINLESGNFDKLKITDIDKILNEESLDPYNQILEKMVSGRYLMKLIYILTNKLVEDNITPQMHSIAQIMKDIDLKEISEWLYYGNSCSNSFYDKLRKLNPTDDQIKVLSLIINTIFDRASSLIAVKLSALIHKRGKGSLIHKPTAIVAEGAVIETLPYFKERLNYYLISMLKEFGDYYYDIIHIEKANIIGSAVAASVNC